MGNNIPRNSSANPLRLSNSAGNSATHWYHEYLQYQVDMQPSFSSFEGGHSCQISTSEIDKCQSNTNKRKEGEEGITDEDIPAIIIHDLSIATSISIGPL
jgi:hypothetical protein